MCLESNLASNAVGMLFPLGLVQASEVGKQLCISSSEMRRMLSRDEYNILRRKETLFRWLHKKGRTRSLSSLVWLVAGFSLKTTTKKLATKSNRRFPFSYP